MSKRSFVRASSSSDGNHGLRSSLQEALDPLPYFLFLHLALGPAIVPHHVGRKRGVVQLYRDKDAIEKDFQTIKTDLRLRPV